MATAPSRAHSFDSAAAEYAAHRPGYPPALFAAVEDRLGRPLTGARAADVGAGTGIATALLHGRGARVTAVEPGVAMADQLRRAHPRIPLVRGDGNALPFADASLDLLTFAQSWHWTDLPRAGAEARRVLRPGGVLALWWNLADTGADWIAAQTDRILARSATADLPGVAATHPGFTPALPDTLAFTRHQFPWSREVPLDGHLANLATHSTFLISPADETRAFFDAEREILLRAFPDGRVREDYVTHLFLATR
ncbi:class I SAM-dependent methyltransferase [Streptomyces sp. NPDC060194]|uniref:class I SAM-dependent methyltransferase n=1 Tax=Streptomyces sp. NPDC060194 TaxID=3347069 RepID=UPI003647C690